MIPQSKALVAPHAARRSCLPQLLVRRSAASNHPSPMYQADSEHYDGVCRLSWPTDAALCASYSNCAMI